MCSSDLGSDSTLKQKMPASSAATISASVLPTPEKVIRLAGAPAASVISFGYWPQVAPAFWSLVLFRWDINVRESIVLGLVGAGGVGMVLDNAMNLFFVGARRDGADCDTGRGGLGGDRCDVYPQADYLSGALPLEISMIMRVAR